MQPPETNDPLEALLHEEDAYIEDAGFTARVMTSLPPRRRSWLRPAILCGATLLGLGLLIWWVPQIKDVFQIDTDGGIAMTFSAQALLTLGVMAAGAGSLIWGMFAVLKWEE